MAVVEPQYCGRKQGQLLNALAPRRTEHGGIKDYNVRTSGYRVTTGRHRAGCRVVGCEGESWVGNMQTRQR